MLCVLLAYMCIPITIFRLQDFKLRTTGLQNEMLSCHTGKFLDFWYRRMQCHVNWLLYQRFWATHSLHQHYVLWNIADRLPVSTASHLSMPLSSVCRILLKYVYDASHFHPSWVFCSVSMRGKKKLGLVRMQVTAQTLVHCSLGLWKQLPLPVLKLLTCKW
jgi:hypothetical protein